MPNFPDPVKQAEAVHLHLMRKGLGPDRLASIGAFIVAYGLFETNLERALWALAETDVSGVRPFTETMTVGGWFGRLAEGSEKLSPEANAVLSLAARVGKDLADYRNSLVHGSLVAFGEGSAFFIRNPAWHGEVRKKPQGDANIDEPMLELAIAATWTLCSVVALAQKVIGQPENEQALIAKLREVQHARSYASEARHIADLMNHEKY